MPTTSKQTSKEHCTVWQRRQVAERSNQFMVNRPPSVNMGSVLKMPELKAGKLVVKLSTLTKSSTLTSQPIDICRLFISTKLSTVTGTHTVSPGAPILNPPLTQQYGYFKSSIDISTAFAVFDNKLVLAGTGQGATNGVSVARMAVSTVPAEPPGATGLRVMV